MQSVPDFISRRRAVHIRYSFKAMEETTSCESDERREEGESYNNTHYNSTNGSGDVAMSRATLFFCLYSLGCLILWDIFWLIYRPPFHSSEHIERYFTYRVLTNRLDKLVSFICAGLFALASMYQRNRYEYCDKKHLSIMPVYCCEFINMVGLRSY